MKKMVLFGVILSIFVLFNTSVTARLTQEKTALEINENNNFTNILNDFRSSISKIQNPNPIEDIIATLRGLAAAFLALPCFFLAIIGGTMGFMVAFIPFLLIAPFMLLSGESIEDVKEMIEQYIKQWAIVFFSPFAICLTMISHSGKITFAEAYQIFLDELENWGCY